MQCALALWLTISGCFNDWICGLLFLFRDLSGCGHNILLKLMKNAAVN